MAFRLFEIYGAGRRVDRRNLENSETKLDRTLLASSRRVYKNHNKALENFGFIPERLSKLYVEIDDPYTKPVLLSIFQRLMKESVENEQNRMTREYCASAEPEFHNAIIRKYKSWDRGLIEFGLDPKIFSITASGRTKRGFAFERAFRDMLERYGFLNCGCDSHIGPRNFVSGKTISKCKHLKKCRPDFVFSDFIIDTKTGIGAITDSEQIERYLQHKPIVYIVTLGGQKIEEVTDTGLIVKISFGQFIRESNSIIGVTLDGAENQILSRVLKNAAWDPFVRR